MHQFNRIKTTQTIEPDRPGEKSQHSVIKRLFTCGTKRSRKRLERRRLIGHYSAEYKTADGDIFKLRLPLADAENSIGKFKECFRVVSLEGFKQLSKLVEISLPISVRMFCEANGSKGDECKKCRLFDRGEHGENSE